MILFRLPWTASLLGAALVLSAWGAVSKKGHALSFFGALCGAGSVLSGLIGGAELSEVTVYVLAVLVCACTGERIRRRDE
jgi:hypothetical protein